tara:strand:+ start:878 stop:1138 length:261 start_codon:yes stop_codon:yes gene_type:complete
MIAFKDKDDGYYQFDWDGVSELPDWTKGLTEVEVAPSIATPFTYQDFRRTAYPPIGDQLDAMWKGGTEQEKMLATILAVKAKFPKS